MSTEREDQNAMRVNTLATQEQPQHTFTGRRGDFLLNSMPTGRGPTQVLRLRHVYKIVHEILHNESWRVSATTPEGVKFSVETKAYNVLDIDAIAQRVCVEIEKKLGIFPNVPKSMLDSDYNKLGDDPAVQPETD